MKKNLKAIIPYLVILFTVLSVIYVSGWLMVVNPIITVCTAIDNGTLSTTVLGWAAVKVFFAGTVSYVIFIIGGIVFSLFSEILEL